MLVISKPQNLFYNRKTVEISKERDLALNDELHKVKIQDWYRYELASIETLANL